MILLHSMKKNQKTLNIVLSNLRSCYTQDGIIAGRHHFTDYWARDGFFAAFGSLAIEDIEIVKKMVDLFFSYQRLDGLIPYRIMRGPVSLGKYLGHPTFYDKPQPTYKLRGFGNEVLDGTTLTVLFSILSKNYHTHLPKIDLVLKYLATREKNGLLWDGFMAEWNDTALKYGNLLYSNIIYWYMYDRLSTINSKYKNKADFIAQALRTQLWNGQYFADWHDYKRQDYFYPFGNCLAIAWGLTTNHESKSILEQCEKIKIGFTLEINSPKYPWWRIDPIQQLAGMGDYQNHSLLWWQPVTAYIAALKKMNLNSQANAQIKLIMEKIIKDKAVYECYDRLGNPVKRWNYTAESPFAWSSGMIIWVFGNLGKNRFPS